MRASKQRWAGIAGFVGLAVFAGIFGMNLLIATSRAVDAYVAFDELNLTLEGFQYEAADQPVLVQISVGNPTDAPLTVESLDLRLAAGIRTVGGGTIREATVIPAHGSTVLTITTAIDDETYVSQLDQASIEWILNGRVLVQLQHGDPTWIPFGTRVGS